MSGMDHERFDDLKEAYALNALTEEERQEFEEYLADHPELQAEIDELVSVASLLALSPEEQEPPRRLRRGLLRTFRAETEQPGLRRRIGFGLREFLGYGRLAAGAAAVALIGLLSWNVFLQAEISELRGQEQQSYELQSPGAPQQAQGEVVRVDEGQTVLVAEDLPPLQEDRTYQIWLIKDGVPEPDSLFRPAGDWAAAPVEGSLSGTDVVAVTVEPAGGSLEPTTDPLLAARLS